jgi:hypothetical protein
LSTGTPALSDSFTLILSHRSIEGSRAAALWGWLDSPSQRAGLSKLYDWLSFGGRACGAALNAFSVTLSEAKGLRFFASLRMTHQRWISY